MRKSIVFWSFLVVAAGSAFVACGGVETGQGPGSTGTGGQGAGGQGTTARSSTAQSSAAQSSTAQSSTAQSSTAQSTSVTASSGSGGGDPCSPPVACTNYSSCISLVDNSAASSFTLRMADLKLTAPLSLTKGLINGVVQNGVTMNLSNCNLFGGGTFSWLLQFDKATGKLKTGGGKPAMDPVNGYSFVNETIFQGGKFFMIAPIIADAPLQGGAFAITNSPTLIIPVYLDLNATAVILLPLHDTKLTGIVSADDNCIGQYNSKNLDPASGCLADDVTPAFIGADGKANSDGKLDAYILLEEADTVIVDAVGQSLCVILSGDAATYGNGQSPAKCKRNAAMKIVFQGDWCNVSNNLACKDSIRLSAGFSASGVKFN